MSALLTTPVVTMLCTSVLLAATAALIPARAHAADAPYPVKPIRVIVPFAAGGSTDILIRTVGQKLSEQLQQQLLIDNRGGAGGAIGAELAAKAPPDGYTIMATTSGVVVVNPSLYKKLSYDPLNDFAPIAIIASLPNMLVVHPSLPVKNVKDLIALAKVHPGQLTYASGGNGTSNHLAGELLKYLAGVNVTHVPYKGGGPAVLAVLTGEVTMLFATMPSAMAQVKDKRLKALAVTSRKRSSAAPELPTMIEAGVKDFDVSIWIGIMAPHGSPEVAIARLNKEVGKALQAPEVASRLRSEGYEPVGSTPNEMTASIKTESAIWARVIKAAGIKAD
ncbi:MAG: Bug family tripartite tricarboxylate transporter substrate binding protein [Burkholderiales bacterium]